MSFFSNPWVVGIGTSLITALIVWLITHKIEYNQRITLANNEAIYSIRLFMIENEFPPPAIVEAMINSTALKYKVKRNKLHDFSALSNIFIKEITDNALISVSKKRELYSLIEKAKALSETLVSKRERVPKKKEMLQFMIPQKEQLFIDNFENFVGWHNYGKGTVIQSQDIAYKGNFSLKKDGNSDPNGGFKKMIERVGLEIVFSGWIYRPSQSAGGLGDRLAIEDANFNGYGFCIDHGSNCVWIERRDAGMPKKISPDHFLFTTKNQWYQFKFFMEEGGQFNLKLFLRRGKLFREVNSDIDNSYNSFDQVAIHGGYPYYIDNLKVERIVE